MKWGSITAGKKVRREPEARGLEPNEELIEVTISRDNDVVKIGVQLSEEIRNELISLLRRYADVFAFLSEEEGERVMQENDEGCCGDHIKSKTMVKKALRAGFFWVTMRKTIQDLVTSCRKCQIHALMTHILAGEIIPMISLALSRVGNRYNRPPPNRFSTEKVLNSGCGLL